MRQLLLLILTASIFQAKPVTAQDASMDLMPVLAKKLELKKYTPGDLQNDMALTKKIALLYTIMRNTPELAIHRMNGQAENQVYTKETGEEVVLDKNGKIVQSCENRGSYNYFNPIKQPLKHFSADLLPWILLGNCPEDTTTITLRIEAYIQDFELGLTRVANHGAYSLPQTFLKQIEDENRAYTMAFLIQVAAAGEFSLDRLLQQDGLKDNEARTKFVRSYKKQLLQALAE